MWVRVWPLWRREKDTERQCQEKKCAEVSWHRRRERIEEGRNKDEGIKSNLKAKSGR